MNVNLASGTIGIVGTGVIGVGWAAYFLARGFDVAASDPAEGAETRLRTSWTWRGQLSSNWASPKEHRGAGFDSIQTSREPARIAFSFRRAAPNERI